MKKIHALIVLLALAALVCALPMSALVSGTNHVEGGIVYRMDGGYAYITAFEEGADTVVYPASVGGYPVMVDPELDWWDLEPSAATKLVVAEGVVELSDIDMWFGGLISLEEIVLPGTLKSIGDWTLCGFTGVRELVIPEGVERIGEYSLHWCEGLERISLPSTLREIGMGTLQGCGKLVEIQVAESNAWFQSVGGALYSKDGKTLVRYPGGRTEPFEMPRSVQIIAEDAFGYNERMTSITLPEGMTVLQDFLFSGCDGLETINIPASVTSIAPWAIPGYGNLLAVNVAPGNAHYQSVDGILYSKDGKTLLCYPSAKPTEVLVIPSLVERFGENAFSGGRYVDGLIIPQGIREIPDSLFSSFTNAAFIEIPASLTSIGSYALPTYGQCARFSVAPGNPTYFDRDGVLFERAHQEEIFAFPPAYGLSYDIPADVTAIGSEVFAYNSMLKTVTIPRGVTVIPDYAFQGCTALERIALPITLTEIGEYAFTDCFMLTSITLPPGLKKIGNGAFYNCSGLAELVIPDSVTQIGEYALREMAEDFVIVGAKDSAAYWYAWEHDILWAEPGGAPGLVAPAGRANPAAVVRNDNAEHTLTLRETPSDAGRALGEYKNGTTVEVLAEEGAWSRVRLGDLEGYMATEFLLLTDPFTKLADIRWGRRVTFGDDALLGHPLLLYSQPLEDAHSVVVEGDESIRILDVFGVWYKVVVEGKTGYVLSQALNVAYGGDEYHEMRVSIVASPNAGDRLNLRKEPSTQSESLGRYFNGTQVEVLEYVGDDWIKVRVDGKEGYMMLKFTLPVYSWESALWGNG